MKKGRSLRRIIGRGLILCLTLFAAYKMYRQYEQSIALDQKIIVVENQIQEEKRRGVELNQKKVYYESDQYLIDQARERFGLIKEDEEVFIIVSPSKED